MNETTPKLVIICIDGARPDIVRSFDIFSPPFAVPDTGPRRLRSVFPSSTATAHASFLTGADTAGHGIVGNRFWNGEPVEGIFQRADNPLASLHPYEFGSLTADSWLNRLTVRGATSAAIHFPHTFDLSDNDPSAAVFCLYAPTRRLKVAIADAGCAAEAATTTYFGEEVTASANRTQGGNALILSIRAENGSWSSDIEPNSQHRVAFDIAAGRVSAYCSWQQISSDEIELTITTAVLTMFFGELDLPWDPDNESTHPATSVPSYTASGVNDFFESPRAEWVREVALSTAGAVSPEILLIRFNQIDHAQEFLYWQACRGSGATRRQAREEIIETYDLVDRCVSTIVESIGPGADYVIFSDHGIETVDRHIGLNAILRECGLARDMTFQGDSHIAYLYVDGTMKKTQLERLETQLRSTDESVNILSDSDLEQLRLPAGSPRVGSLAVMCGPHCKFTYNLSDARVAVVQSASHGNVISDPDMDGVIRMFGPNALLVPVPDAIVECAEVIESLWKLQTKGTC
ncbi:alkaline phosphatase family protein [Nocardia sp. NPDC051570]|uniref:alkaline phosphatase family protein n=1 Tax=Nocardia sp. NPDC051570 TaxID=3364324 RepID=UPI00379D68A8